jgi:glycosyltransferase involved in cell wall biosynthesis
MEPSQSQTPLESNDALFPSFSIVVETENLSSAEIAGLTRCLDTIAAQDLSPMQVQEVLIVESGDVPKETIDRLCIDYPFLSVRRIDADIDYYAAKMKGVALTTGEVVVLADSDCIYEPSWLINLLTPFTQPEIQVVAGEITTPVTGAYELAIALTYIFPRFSERVNLDRTRSYLCSNVAFRREFLIDLPIPLQLPIYRGNCTIHARSILDRGYSIWHQPKARAIHAAPNGLAHFSWRFFLLGYDGLAVSRLERQSSPTEPLSFKPLEDLTACGWISLWKVKQLLHRCNTVFAEAPRRLFDLPLALPIAIAALVLFFAGLLFAYFRPNYLLVNARKIEAKWEHSQS